MKLGAADYLKKPVDLDELVVVMDKVMRSARIRSRLDYSRTRESRAADVSGLLGNSAPLREARKQIQAIALKPGYAEAYSNRGVALKDLKRLDEASLEALLASLAAPGARRQAPGPMQGQEASRSATSDPGAGSREPGAGRREEERRA